MLLVEEPGQSHCGKPYRGWLTITKAQDLFMPSHWTQDCQTCQVWQVIIADPWHSLPHTKERWTLHHPLAYYRRQNSFFQNFLIKAKVPQSQTRPKRKIPGLKKCQKCVIFPFIKDGKTIKGPSFTWIFNEELTCSTQNIVYTI